MPKTYASGLKAQPQRKGQGDPSLELFILTLGLEL